MEGAPFAKPLPIPFLKRKGEMVTFVVEEARPLMRESRDACVAGCGLRVAGCGLRVAGCGLRVAGCGLQVQGAGSGF